MWCEGLRGCDGERTHAVLHTPQIPHTIYISVSEGGCSGVSVIRDHIIKLSPFVGLAPKRDAETIDGCPGFLLGRPRVFDVARWGFFLSQKSYTAACQFGPCERPDIQHLTAEPLAGTRSAAAIRTPGMASI